MYQKFNFDTIFRECHYVFKLQKQIFKAFRQGDLKKVRQLQKTLRRSWSNRLLAVRRVTQDNRGKKTAGVDGVKSLTPTARIKLAKQHGLKNHLNKFAKTSDCIYY